MDRYRIDDSGIETPSPRDFRLSLQHPVLGDASTQMRLKSFRSFAGFHLSQKCCSAAILFLSLFSFCTEISASSAWNRVPEILARTVPPSFPDKIFSILDYGAIGDGYSDCTSAIRDAILACHEAGGGRVIIPAGIFLSGAIHLKSRVHLVVSQGATVRFYSDPQKYLPVVFTRYEGTECYNYSPFLYAFEQEDIAVTGSGTLDGQADADHWWNWTTRHANDVALLRLWAENGIPVEQRIFGEGHFLRPNMIQLVRCRNALIEGVKIVNSPMWNIHPVLCQNVIVRNVSVDSHGPNNDGCNPESCKDVWIQGCTFDTGDDCIACKSGRNADGRRIQVPTEDVVIQDCDMKDGHGGVVIGSEITGGCRNVFAENCRMNSPNLDRVLRIKTNSVRGGLIENVFLRNIEVGQVGESIIHVDYYYGEGDTGPYTPVVRNIELQNVTSQKSLTVFHIRAYPRSPVTNVRLLDCSLNGVTRPEAPGSVERLHQIHTTVNGKIQPDSSLVAYYPLDDGQGISAVDASDFGNDGIFETTGSDGWTTGRSGKAAGFHNVSDRLTVAHSPAIDFGKGSFTFLFWIHGQPDQNGTVLVKGSSKAEGAKGFAVEIEDEFSFTLDDNTVKTRLGVSKDDFLTGGWMHVAVVRDTSRHRMQLYSNGLLKAAKTDGTGDLSKNEPLFFGNRAGLDAPFIGALDEIRLFNYALDSAEIRTFFLNTQTGVSRRHLAAAVRPIIQVRPNPFNPVTTVGYSVPETGHVRFSIFNIAGQETSVLVDEEKSAGRYAIPFHAGDLPSGVYLLRLKTVSFIVHAKITVMK